MEEEGGMEERTEGGRSGTEGTSAANASTAMDNNGVVQEPLS